MASEKLDQLRELLADPEIGEEVMEAAKSRHLQAAQANRDIVDEIALPQTEKDHLGREASWHEDRAEAVGSRALQAVQELRGILDPEGEIDQPARRPAGADPSRLPPTTSIDDGPIDPAQYGGGD